MDIAGMSGLTNYLVDSNKNSTQALEKKLDGAAAADVADAELLDACKQFEAYLWEQVLKGMQKTVKMFGDDDEEEAYAGNMVNTFMDTFVQDIAAQMTNESQGANSLAQTLYEQMKRTYSAENL
ncbi:MAG: hypothetical protein HFI48_02745 [Lachnospiraceae bacterium]|nr:hypothetical protein [Lachnospiraceae bacterium]